MRHHIMIALGILMIIIFAFRTFAALMNPGWELYDLYLVGGMFLGGWLLASGGGEWLQIRKNRANT